MRKLRCDVGCTRGGRENTSFFVRAVHGAIVTVREPSKSSSRATDHRNMSPAPKAFYKYRPFDLNTLRSICHDKLYFSLPSDFNDPFDSRPTLECDSNIPELRGLLEQLIQRRVSAEIRESLGRARLRDEKANLYASRQAVAQARKSLSEIAYHATNPDYEEGPQGAEEWLLTKEVERELLRHYERGVCCFSTDCNNPLLWSHYAERHEGICIGYTTKRIPNPYLQRVVYGGRRSIKSSLVGDAFCRAGAGSEKILDRNVLLRKAKEWSYESEWRLIGPVGLIDSPLLMTEITFGLRCPEAVRHAVVRSLSGRVKAVRFYEMSETSRRYSLIKGVLDIEELSRYLPKVAESGEEMFGPVVEEAQTRA